MAEMSRKEKAITFQVKIKMAEVVAASAIFIDFRTHLGNSVQEFFIRGNLPVLTN